jgi:hypothetical protein
MRRVAFNAVFLTLVSVATLAGCSSGSSTPAATPTPSNISGDYSGTVQDGHGGSGTAAGTLAQSGFDAGGAITITEAATTLTAQLSLTLTTSNATSGSMVIDYPNNGPTCTFNTTGTYNPSTNVLSGSYTAVTNCSGDSGTYSLTQQCTDTITSGRLRRMTGGVTAC